MGDGRIHQFPDAKKSHRKGTRGLDVVPVFRAPPVVKGRVHQFSDKGCMHQFPDEGCMHQFPDAKKSHGKGMRGRDVVPVFRAPRVGDGRVHQFSDEGRMHQFPDAKKSHGKGMRGLDVVPVF